MLYNPHISSTINQNSKHNETVRPLSKINSHQDKSKQDKKEEKLIANYKIIKLIQKFNIHLIIRDKDNPWYVKFVTSSQYPYYEALCEEELQKYIKNARQFFKTTKNEENFYFSSSYGVFNVL